jgi:hypothetical protein
MFQALLAHPQETLSTFGILRVMSVGKYRSLTYFTHRASKMQLTLLECGN